jgi:hypothetical protein
MLFDQRSAFFSLFNWLNVCRICDTISRPSSSWFAGCSPAQRLSFPSNQPGLSVDSFFSPW